MRLILAQLSHSLFPFKIALKVTGKTGQILQKTIMLPKLSLKLTRNIEMVCVLMTKLWSLEMEF